MATHELHDLADRHEMNRVVIAHVDGYDDLTAREFFFPPNVV
jgi:hypothetical protein